MKLLIITNNPDRASFRQRIGVYLDILKADGIECEVARLPGGIAGRWKLLGRTREFDGVLLHKKGLNPVDALRLRRCSRKIIYNFDDAVMYSDKKPDRYGRSHFVPFRRSVRMADLVITGSSYLAEHARKFNSNVEVLPLGLKVSDYAVDRPDPGDDKTRLVWIGSRTTLSYLEGIRDAIEQVGSRCRKVVLRIIGDDFLDLDNVPVEKRSWSAETRGIDLAGSDIGLAPLPDNRFTQGKCSFKVLEYSAAGLPVIASPVGTNSEYVKEGVTGFLATDTRQWVDRMTQLIENPALRRQMGREGRSWAGNFDISVIGTRLCNLIAGCMQNPEVT